MVGMVELKLWVCIQALIASLMSVPVVGVRGCGPLQGQGPCICRVPVRCSGVVLGCASGATLHRGLCLCFVAKRTLLVVASSQVQAKLGCGEAGVYRLVEVSYACICGGGLGVLTHTCLLRCRRGCGCLLPVHLYMQAGRQGRALLFDLDVVLCWLLEILAIAVPGAKP